MKRFLLKGGKFKYHFSVQVRSVSLRDRPVGLATVHSTEVA